MKRNKGFSLVELIIVIAIMAILIGVMAPQLIRYIEKTNVSSDTQLLDTMHTAVYTSLSDPDVISDPNSKIVMSYFSDGTPHMLSQVLTINASSEFVESFEELTGLNSASNFSSLLKSSPAKNSGVIMVWGDGNNLYLWIDHSDARGKKNNCTFVNANITETLLKNSNVIFVN